MTADARFCWLAAGVAIAVWLLIIGGVWWHWIAVRPHIL